ncbi:hypothetical protein MVEN_00229000 [Mycena venus]|uniref:Uncharacterized protein n=1 Tax=Mycena venus TaxID=2733690 RepID=A0A8H6Z1M8_9AGAR|nr:hypothetical protein MVEN_00229000 [Mycena venus]
MFPLRVNKPPFDENAPLSLTRYFEDVEELSVLKVEHDTGAEFQSRENVARYNREFPRSRTVPSWMGDWSPMSLPTGYEVRVNEHFLTVMSHGRPYCREQVSATEVGVFDAKGRGPFPPTAWFGSASLQYLHLL